MNVSPPKTPLPTAWWKGTRLRYAIAAAVVLLPTLAFFLLRARPDRPGLTAAERQFIVDRGAFGGRHELDKDGHVTRLAFEGKKFGDAAIAEVHTLPYLRRLSLQKSMVTDQGILDLVKCKRLEALNIIDTKVTDAGLAQLQHMPSLRELWVSENEKLTGRGISALGRALPTVRVSVAAKSGEGKGQGAKTVAKGPGPK